MSRLRSIRIKASIAVLAIGSASMGAAQEPLSVIDWLTEDLVVAQPAPALPTPQAPRDEPPVSSNATVPDIEMRPLDAPNLAATGLLPPNRTGLPVTLWQASEADTLIDLITALDSSETPAMTALLFTLLVAEADAPARSGDGAGFLAVRARKLLEMGAVDAAEALLASAGPEKRALFPVWLDATLLTGQENTACAALRAAPPLSQDLSARIFCAARGQDWQTAATVLDTATALGSLPERRAEVLQHFLNPELADNMPPLSPPVRPTPLEYRLYEAIGERPLTRTLPLPFATIDLRGDAGWRAQIEAAERLARAGAISENQLLGIYTERLPAASGGIWTRVEALQRFDQAITTGDPGAIATSLLRVWPEMRNAGLGEAFASLYGARLLDYPLRGEAEETALRVALLSPDYEMAAARAAAEPGFALAAAIARGNAPDVLPQAPVNRALAEAFAGPPAAPAHLATQLEQGRLGEVILRAMALYANGGPGNPQGLRDGLTTLRAVGLEDAARRAALQTLLGRRRALP